MLDSNNAQIRSITSDEETTGKLISPQILAQKNRGGTIDVNNATLTNYISQRASPSFDVPTNWTGSLTVKCSRSGDLVNLVFTGMVEVATTASSFNPVNNTFSAEYRPFASVRFPLITDDNTTVYVYCYADGRLEITKPDGSGWTAGERIKFTLWQASFTFGTY